MYHSTCSTKRIYFSQAEAESVADHQMSVNYGLSLRVYYCDVCRAFHLTSKPRRYA